MESGVDSVHDEQGGCVLVRDQHQVPEYWVLHHCGSVCGDGYCQSWAVQQDHRQEYNWLPASCSNFDCCDVSEAEGFLVAAQVMFMSSYPTVQCSSLSRVNTFVELSESANPSNQPIYRIYLNDEECMII